MRFSRRSTKHYSYQVNLDDSFCRGAAWRISLVWIDKAKKNLGFHPEISTEEGLEILLEDLRKTLITQ